MNMIDYLKWRGDLTFEKIRSTWLITCCLPISLTPILMVLLMIAAGK